MEEKKPSPKTYGGRKQVAGKISAYNEDKPSTFSVRMVGTDDVKRLIGQAIEAHKNSHLSRMKLD